MKTFGYVVLGILIFIGLWVFGKTMFFADKVVGNALTNYEEFQEIYNTCQQLNSDLAVIKGIPDTDKMFSQISKQAMLAAKKQTLNRWIEEYNAKSKMWNRNLWKSDKLPYSLNTNDFSNYNG